MIEGDRGAASVLGAFVALALVVVTALLVSVGAAVAARHQAQSAADLAALAGAAAVVGGVEAGCAAATESAVRMGGVLDECRVEEWDVQVRVRIPIALIRFGERDAVAQARAGRWSDPREYVHIVGNWGPRRSIWTYSRG